MVDNKFNLYQQLPAAGANRVHAFTHKGKQYLAVVSTRNDVYEPPKDSPVYVWTELWSKTMSFV